MFTGPKYVTQGIREEIPSFLQYIIWYLIGTMNVDAKDYLQVFQLDSVTEGGTIKQKVIHTQEQPDYRREYCLCNKQVVTGKIYVIDDFTHCTMLLVEEYQDMPDS